MTTSEERMKILSMIQDGTITAEEGMHLLEALDAQDQPRPGEKSGKTVFAKSGGKYFRVRVTDMDTGKTRVNIRLPISVVSAGLKMGAKFSPEVEGMDMTQLMELVRAGETGQVVDIIDDEDGERVEVFIE